MKSYPLVEDLVRPGGRVLFLLLAIWAIAGRPAEAKIYAYIIAEDLTVLKFDTDTDTVVSRQTLPRLRIVELGAWDAYVSRPDNLLFLSYATSQTKGDVKSFRIVAFDLRTLTLKKDLGMVWPERPDILIPPTGPHFFILGFDPSANNGQGGLRAARYSKATLTSLGDLPHAPEVQQTVFSADGSRLYSFTAGRLEPIQIFNATDLRLVASLDVSSLLSRQGFAASIRDLQGDRALVVQNMKPMGVTPVEHTLFTVRLPDGASSTRIATGLRGRGYIIPPGEKVLLDENAVVRAPDGSVQEVRSVGRLHVYDVTTGTKLGQVAFPIRGPGDVWAFHPSGDKVYFRMLPAPDQDYTVAVISLTSFSVVKELKLPSSSILFVDESP